MTQRDQENALRLLDEGYTCAIIYGENCLRSKERGIKPLMDWIKEKKPCGGGIAADKVVGKAAAFLYVLLGVKEIHAKVLSEGAERVFLRYGVAYTFAEKVSAIRNRTDTGFCPMETAVLGVDDPQTAYEILIQKEQK